MFKLSVLLSLSISLASAVSLQPRQLPFCNTECSWATPALSCTLTPTPDLACICPTVVAAGPALVASCLTCLQGASPALAAQLAPFKDACFTSSSSAPPPATTSAPPPPPSTTAPPPPPSTTAPPPPPETTSTSAAPLPPIVSQPASVPILTSTIKLGNYTTTKATSTKASPTLISFTSWGKRDVVVGELIKLATGLLMVAGVFGIWL